MLNLQLTDTPVLHNSFRSIDPKRVVTKRISTSGIVYPKSCWLLWVKVYCPKVTQWLVPDEMQDPNNDWSYEERAADENLVTFTFNTMDIGGLSKLLVLFYNSYIWFEGIVIYSLQMYGDYASVWFYYWDGSEYISFGIKQCTNKVWSTKKILTPIRTNKTAIRINNYTGEDNAVSFVFEIRFIHILDTKLLLRDGFSSQDRPIVDICPKWNDVEHIVFNKPIKFNKGLYATLAPAGSYAEFGFVPV